MSEVAITVGIVEGCAVATVAGDVDLNSAESVVAALERVGGRDGRLIVDLGAVGYLDSTGLRALDALDRRLRALHTRFALVAPPACRVGRLLSLTGLDRGLAVHRTLDDAVGAIA